MYSQSLESQSTEPQLQPQLQPLKPQSPPIYSYVNIFIIHFTTIHTFHFKININLFIYYKFKIYKYMKFLTINKIIEMGSATGRL